ncbi:MAG TPA: type 4a pilus biogenesis protein PilO [Opitutaceae bacterium]|jgi:hypothetical protein
MNSADIMQWIATLRRNPISTLCGVIVALCIAACFYIHRDRAWLELDYKQVQQDTDLDFSSVISGPSVKQERLAAVEVSHRIEANLVNEDNLAENLWYFYKIEEQTKAHIAELRPLNSVVTNSRAYYRRVPFSVRITGSYEQTADFLYAVETGPRLSNITQLSYRRTDPDGTQVILDFTVELLGKR